MKRALDAGFLLRWGLPLLALLLLLAMPLLLSDFRLSQLGRFLTLAIVALGLDYAGIFSNSANSLIMSIK